MKETKVKELFKKYRDVREQAFRIRLTLVEQKNIFAVREAADDLREQYNSLSDELIDLLASSKGVKVEPNFTGEAIGVGGDIDSPDFKYLGMVRCEVTLTVKIVASTIALVDEYIQKFPSKEN